MIGGASPQPLLASVRYGDAADLDAVLRIMDSAFDDRFGEAWTRGQCAGILPMPGVVLTLAEAAGEPVGFSLHRTVADESELLLLAVKREAQRRGIGALLLRQFLEDARTVGARQVHLEVRENNPAISIYRSVGFHPVGRRKNYYSGNDGSQFDALTFVSAVTVLNSDGI
jgi:ribosomal-protein-alanine N-acetyltransferase